jgi:hypothetical protein
MFIQLAGNHALVGSFHQPVEQVIHIDIRLPLIIQPIMLVFVVNHCLPIYLLHLYGQPPLYNVRP